MARGYLGHPALTAEKFVPDPFASEPGGRLYRTGDLVRQREDGKIEFLGRRDHQVKIRGFRVEPGEIESVLGQHPAVSEALVMVREDVPGDKRLVGYVVLEPASAASVVDLKTYLEGRLPDHMVPGALMLLERLPLNANGKVDRHALPAPQGRPELEEGYQEPRGPVEEGVCGVWRDVLALEKVGVHDDFFDLGGHSLTATQVVSRLRQVFRVELSVRALFESPTVAGLAERVEQARRPGGVEPAPPIRPVSRDGELPLSFAQQRLWFLDQMRTGSAYHVPLALRLEGPLDRGALQASLNEIVRRHESLRTSFPAHRGRPLQVIAKELDLPLPEVDLGVLGASEREAATHRLVTEEAHRAMDLERGPVVRARLWKLAAEDHVLLLNLHHVVADGWSLAVLNRELTALYRAFTRGEASPLRELPVQYADFSAWQRQWLVGEALERQVSYWKGRLEGLPTLQLPTDHPRPAVSSYQGANHYFVIGEELAEGLKTLALREGATLFMTLLTAFKALLSRYSGQEDVAVGSPIANRHRCEIEGLIGFFVNSLVLRTDLAGDLNFRKPWHGCGRPRSVPTIIRTCPSRSSWRSSSPSGT